jgi:hypothetical protein
MRRTNTTISSLASKTSTRRLQVERLEERTFLTASPYAAIAPNPIVGAADLGTSIALFNLTILSSQFIGSSPTSIASSDIANAGFLPVSFSGATAGFAASGVGGRGVEALSSLDGQPVDWQSYLAATDLVIGGPSFYRSAATGRPFAAASDVLFSTGNPFNIG